MKAILEQLHKTLEVVDQKHKEQLHLDSVLSSKEAALNKRESEQNARQDSLNTREAGLVEVENMAEYRRKTEELAAQVTKDHDQLRKDKESFRILQEAQNGKLAEDKKALDNGWKELREKEKNVDAGLTSRLEELVKGMKAGTSK